MSSSQNEGLQIDLKDGAEAKALLTPDELHRLTEHVVEETTGLSVRETRDGLHEVFVHPEEVSYVQEFVDAGRMTVARVAGKTIGMLGYKEAGSIQDSHGGTRPVFELCRASVLPEFEGRGVYTRLKRHVFDVIQQAYPGSLIVSTTKDQTVKNSNREYGYEDISLERFLEIRGIPPQEIPERARLMREQDRKGEWQQFLFDPLKNQD